jgi:hypothetical protein
MLFKSRLIFSESMHVSYFSHLKKAIQSIYLNRRSTFLFGGNAKMIKDIMSCSQILAESMTDTAHWILQWLENCLQRQRMFHLKQRIL